MLSKVGNLACSGFDMDLPHDQTIHISIVFHTAEKLSIRFNNYVVSFHSSVQIIESTKNKLENLIQMASNKKSILVPHIPWRIKQTFPRHPPSNPSKPFSSWVSLPSFRWWGQPSTAKPVGRTTLTIENTDRKPSRSW